MRREPERHCNNPRFPGAAFGTERADPKRPILCADKVRYVGDNVAFIVAETPFQAKDAADLVEVDYEELEAVVDTATADTLDNPLVHDRVRWTAERAEGFLSDTMGRDHVTQAELAFDADQRIVRMRVCTRANMGAYLSRWGPGIPTNCATRILPADFPETKTPVREECSERRASGSQLPNSPENPLSTSTRTEGLHFF